MLWDLSYLLDTSARISLGQMPYRDFPFAHAPLTFLLHAAIIRVFGRVYFPHIACAAAEGGITALLTWRILLILLRPLADRAWGIALLLATPLAVLGIYAIYPHPIYDSDCILAVLTALYLLLRAEESPWRNVLAGAACVLPLFFKQNIGLPFLLITLVCVALIAMLRRLQRVAIAPQLWTITGSLVTLAAALLILHATVGLYNYLYWTITFAAQRRLPGLGLILDTYRQGALLWTIPTAIAGLVLLRINSTRWARMAAVLMLAAPFLWTIVDLALTSDPDDRTDQLLSLWPHLLLLAAALTLANLCSRGLRTNPALAPLLAAHPARHHPRGISLAAAMGIHLRNLAVADAAYRGDAYAGLRDRAPTRRHHLGDTPSLRRIVCGEPRPHKLHPPRRRREPRHAARAARPDHAGPVDS